MQFNRFIVENPVPGGIIIYISWYGLVICLFEVLWQLVLYPPILIPLDGL